MLMLMLLVEKARLAYHCSLKFGTPWSHCPESGSINTCLFTASNAIGMKYKGKMKYIKVLIRYTA